MSAQGGGPENQKAILKTEVESFIKLDRVVIFSKDNCPYCDHARNVFHQMGQSFSEVELSDSPQSVQVQEVLKEMTGESTVPRVFVDGKCIGGGADTVKLYESGQLGELLGADENDTTENHDPNLSL